MRKKAAFTHDNLFEKSSVRDKVESTHVTVPEQPPVRESPYLLTEGTGTFLYFQNQSDAEKCFGERPTAFLKYLPKSDWEAKDSSSLIWPIVIRPS